MLDNDQGGSWGQAHGGLQPFVPAHDEFRSSLQSAWPSADAERAVTDAFAAYAAIVQEPWGSADLRQRAADAYAECTSRVHEAFARGGADRVVAAYRRYVQQLKRVWADLNPDALAPADLGEIAQGMAWVAGVALEVSAALSPTVEPRSRS